MQLYTSLTNFTSGHEPGQLCYTIVGTGPPDVPSVDCPGRWRYIMWYTNTSNGRNKPILNFGEVDVRGK